MALVEGFVKCFCLEHEALSHVLCVSGYRQCLVPECELTKPIFGYFDGKSMLIASTLVDRLSYLLI